jgi:hypothetical protein
LDANVNEVSVISKGIHGWYHVNTYQKINFYDMRFQKEINAFEYDASYYDALEYNAYLHDSDLEIMYIGYHQSLH